MLPTDTTDYRKSTTRALLAAISRHDPLALAEVYHRTVAAAHACAARLVGERHEIEGLLRAAYASLWDEPPQDAPLEAWIRHTVFVHGRAYLRETGRGAASPSTTLLLRDAPVAAATLDRTEQLIASLDDDALRALLLAHDRGIPTADQRSDEAESDLRRALYALAESDDPGECPVPGLADWILGLLDDDEAHRVSTSVLTKECAEVTRSLKRGRRRLEGLPPPPDLGQRVIAYVLARGAPGDVGPAEGTSAPPESGMVFGVAAAPAVEEAAEPGTTEAGITEPGTEPGGRMPTEGIEDTAAAPEAGTIPAEEGAPPMPPQPLEESPATLDQPPWDDRAEGHAAPTTEPGGEPAGAPEAEPVHDLDREAVYDLDAAPEEGAPQRAHGPAHEERDVDAPLIGERPASSALAGDTEEVAATAEGTDAPSALDQGARDDWRDALPRGFEDTTGLRATGGTSYTPKPPGSRRIDEPRGNGGFERQSLGGPGRQPDSTWSTAPSAERAPGETLAFEDFGIEEERAGRGRRILTVTLTVIGALLLLAAGAVAGLLAINIFLG